ncbi:MAG: flagellar biosynthesis protein FlhF [Phycisphaerales bacterium JB050]
MAIKTFRGKSVNEALALVKRELGPNAVILHTKTHKVGGVFGIGAHTVTEITATADASVARSVQSRNTQRERTAAERPRQHTPEPSPERRATRRELLEYARSTLNANASSATAVAPTRPAAVDLDPLDPLAALASRRTRREPSESTERTRPQPSPKRRLRQSAPNDALPMDDEFVPTRPPARREEPKERNEPTRDAPRPQPERRTEPSQSRPTPVAEPAPTSSQAQPSAIEAELAALRRMVTQVLQSSRVGGVGTQQDALTDLYAKLIENELAAELADEISTVVREELNRDELASPDIVRQSILRHLAAHIPVSRSLPPAGQQEDGRPLTLALIGPTGVGKTTTLAKLAATYKLRRGKKVGLVTCDTYRIAAVDQLRTYANIIGLPLKVALTPADMRQACEQLSDCDVILIDTAGRSQRDVGKIDELRQLVDAAAPHQTHLVLSSTHSERVLAEAAAKFVDIQPDHVIFTKLDEAVSVGLVVNTLRRLNAKLSFVTTGQEVPDQIELGNADRIARLVVDGGSAR